MINIKYHGKHGVITNKINLFPLFRRKVYIARTHCQAIVVPSYFRTYNFYGKIKISNLQKRISRSIKTSIQQ